MDDEQNVNTGGAAVSAGGAVTNGNSTPSLMTDDVTQTADVATTTTTMTVSITNDPGRIQTADVNVTSAVPDELPTSGAVGYSWTAVSPAADWPSPAALPSSSAPSSSSMTSSTWDARTTGHYHVEDEFTGLHNILSRDDDVSDSRDQSRDLITAILVTIITLAIVCNLIVCIVVRIDRRLHQMTYYFFVSMATLHIAMATVVMPPALIIVLTGTFDYPEELCKLWITMDFFFCNSTSLHLAFVNMDAFLRLKDPLRHGRVSTTCSLLLWLGAPWAISTVQSVAQFMLSQEDEGTVRGNICFIDDKNFILLGVTFSFLIPTVISLIFYGLCVHELRMLRAGKFLDDSESSNPTGCPYGSNDSMAAVDDDDDDVDADGVGGGSSDSASYLSDGGAEADGGGVGAGGGRRGQGVVHERVQLAVVTNMKASGTDLASSASYPEPATCGLRYGVEETTSFCDDGVFLPSATADEETSSRRYGHANVAFQYSERQAGEQSSCTLLLRDANAPAGAGGLGGAGAGATRHGHSATADDDDETPTICSTADYDHCSPDEVLRREVATSRLMFLLLLFCITLWVPYSASNVVYGTCEHCRRDMTFAEVMTFRWLAYGSAVVGPWIYVRFSEPLRQAVWSMLTCRYCKWQQ